MFSKNMSISDGDVAEVSCIAAQPSSCLIKFQDFIFEQWLSQPLLETVIEEEPSHEDLLLIAATLPAMLTSLDTDLCSYYDHHMKITQ